MDSTEFDRALVAAAFQMIAADGWQRLTVAAAAREAGLELGQARLRFPTRFCVLARFGAMADAQALEGTTLDGPVRDRLFDIVMRRIDALQAHRAGVLALFDDLPRDPLTAVALAGLSLRSMGWLLEGAGLSRRGLLGGLRAKGMLAVWLATVQAWRGDESEDLAATMAALDRALNRAEQAENTVSGRSASDQ